MLYSARICAALLLALLPARLGAQTDETDDIQLSAAFEASIDLRVTEGSSISFVVATTSEYTGGLASPYQYFSEFTVTSSTAFQVVLSAADLADGAGRTLDIRNLGCRLTDYGTHTAGVQHLLMGAAASPSALALLGPSLTLITATGPGNAGTAAQNRFRIQFELATPELRALSGLPTLLEQRITPGVYRTVILLTASPMP